MTREEAISIMKVIVHMLEEKYDTDRVEEAVDMAISALSEKDWKFYYDHGYAQAKRDLSENKGNLISREAVLKIIDGWYEQNRDTDNIEDLIVLITYMDSVNPQKPICPSEGVDPAYEKMLNKWIGAEVLDDIRAEIENKYESISDTFHHYETGFTDALEWALSIIGKYMAESEVSDAKSN